MLVNTLILNEQDDLLDVTQTHVAFPINQMHLQHFICQNMNK